MDKIKQKRTEKIFVFQLKDGYFYTPPRKGAWSTDPITKKDISCEFVEKAWTFTEDFKDNIEIPYLHKALEGGRWVEIQVTTLYEEI